jgi:hypothetical protein
MKMLTRNEERVLLMVGRGEPWDGVGGSWKLRAGRLATLRRLARMGMVDPAEWTLTVYGVAYAVAVRVGAREAVCA